MVSANADEPKIRKRKDYKMAKYSVSFKVNCEDYLIADEKVFFEGLEYDLKDLIKVAVLPTLNLELIPLTFEVKRSRN